MVSVREITRLEILEGVSIRIGGKRSKKTSLKQPSFGTEHTRVDITCWLRPLTSPTSACVVPLAAS